MNNFEYLLAHEPEFRAMLVEQLDDSHLMRAFADDCAFRDSVCDAARLFIPTKEHVPPSGVHDWLASEKTTMP